MAAVLRMRGAQLTVMAAGLCVVLVLCAGSAGGKTIGIVPPKNPKSNCDKKRLTSEQWTVISIDRCRAAEGVGPMVLPKNWKSLSSPKRLLVVIDLERVNRGLAPVLGLSAKLDAYAKRGAAANGDPGFPTSGFIAGGSIWAGADTVFESDYGWMYDDGWGAVDINLDCTSERAPGCWGHRDNVLMDRVPPIVGGGAYVKHKRYGSFAFEMLAGYSQRGLSFTWKSELHHFTRRPRVERLKKPIIKSISPRSGSARGGTAVLIKGENLQSITKVDFGASAGSFLECLDGRQCDVIAPGHAAGEVKVIAINHAGRSRLISAATFTYKG